MRKMDKDSRAHGLSYFICCPFREQVCSPTRESSGSRCPCVDDILGSRYFSPHRTGLSARESKVSCKLKHDLLA